MSSRPNVLFLLSDEHSYRCFGHLDPGGEGEPVDTPNLDELASRATVFHQTYCQVALCTPP
jgi:arylsulfatase A-like enzyme